MKNITGENIHVFHLHVTADEPVEHHASYTKNLTNQRCSWADIARDTARIWELQAMEVLPER
jgi:hypothetical protein